MASDRASNDALKNMIDEVERLISTTVQLPENRTPRCLELLRAASALASDVASRGSGIPQPEMDEAAKVARHEFEEKWQSWSIKDLAVWWQEKRWSVGHKRLGRMLVDVAGDKIDIGVPLPDDFEF